MYATIAPLGIVVYESTRHIESAGEFLLPHGRV